MFFLFFLLNKLTKLNRNSCYFFFNSNETIINKSLLQVASIAARKGVKGRRNIIIRASPLKISDQPRVTEGFNYFLKKNKRFDDQTVSMVSFSLLLLLVPLWLHLRRFSDLHFPGIPLYQFFPFNAKSMPWNRDWLRGRALLCTKGAILFPTYCAYPSFYNQMMSVKMK